MSERPELYNTLAAKEQELTPVEAQLLSYIRENSGVHFMQLVFTEPFKGEKLPEYIEKLVKLNLIVHGEPLADKAYFFAIDNEGNVVMPTVIEPEETTDTESVRTEEYKYTIDEDESRDLYRQLLRAVEEADMYDIIDTMDENMMRRVLMRFARGFGYLKE